MSFHGRIFYRVNELPIKDINGNGMITVPIDPKSIELSGEVGVLLQQLDENLARVNELRPFADEANAAIRRAFLPERITATLNIEGIAATRRQTLTIMDGIAVSQNLHKEEKEIFNALKADEFVYHCYEDSEILDQRIIREVNGLILNNVHADGGRYRKTDVEITGATFVPPAPSSINPIMTEIVDHYNQADFLHPVVQAAWLHHHVAYAHPFIDGNGRTARLMQDFSLLRRGLFPTGIPSSQRDQYYQALQEADKGDWNEFVSIIAQIQLVTVGKIESIVRDRKDRNTWIGRIAGMASQKKTGAMHKQYIVWRSRMENIREAFCRAAFDLDEASFEVGATYRVFDTMNFEDWKLLVTSGRRPPLTWSFSIIFFIDGEASYKLIGYFDRHRKNAFDFNDKLSDQSSLLFTGVEANSADKPDYNNFSDSHIELRELLYIDDQLSQRKQSKNDVSWEEVNSIDDVVRNLFESVFLKKLGLDG